MAGDAVATMFITGANKFIGTWLMRNEHDAEDVVQDASLRVS